MVSRLFRILNRNPAFMNGEAPLVTDRHRDVIESQREQHFVQTMRERPAILQKVNIITALLKLLIANVKLNKK